jgi:hypothetical protein
VKQDEGCEGEVKKSRSTPGQIRDPAMRETKGGEGREEETN